MEENGLESAPGSFAGKTEKKIPGSEPASSLKQQGKTQGDFTETDALTKSRIKGGQACLEKYGIEHYRGMGQKGGNTTKQRYDAEHYRRIGALGREARRKKKRAR
jgi:uncharacterized protein